MAKFTHKFDLANWARFCRPEVFSVEGTRVAMNHSRAPKFEFATFSEYKVCTILDVYGIDFAGLSFEVASKSVSLKFEQFWKKFVTLGASRFVQFWT